MLSVPRSYKQSVDSELSSAWEAVKIGPESVMLKNLYCLKPLPENG
jgi:hypothetical protein